MSYFVITPGTGHVALDATSRTATLVFSVQNKTGMTRRVRGAITVEDPAQGDWYTVREPVRQVRVDETVQFQVDITVPKDVEAGRHAFRLKVLATDDPDDVHHESQLVPLDVPPLIDNGGMPWWLWLVIAAAAVAVVGVLAFMLFRDGDPVPPTPSSTATPTPTPTEPGAESSTPTTEPTTPGTEPTTPDTKQPEAGLEGTWDLVRWVEAEGPVQLGFTPIDGVLVIDADRNAVWQFRIDDQFADNEGNAASRCEGAIDLSRRLTPTRGPDELFWTDNMRSLRVDIGLAFCGRAIDPERGQLRSPFTIVQEGEDLEMRNEHGTFSWRRR